jgi:pyridoxine kinase
LYLQLTQSNHTGYPTWTGQKLSCDEFKAVVKGLEGNNILPTYTHLLTGYVGAIETLEEICMLAVSMKRNKDLFVVIDPVLGDEGRLYVDAKYIGCYRDSLLKVADLICPNGFEAELLTGLMV